MNKEKFYWYGFWTCLALLFIGICLDIEAKASDEDRVYLHKLIEHDNMKIYEFQHDRNRTCYIVRTKVMGGGAASMTCL